MNSCVQSLFKIVRNIATAVSLGAVLAGCQSMSANIGLDADNTSYKRMVTQGEATKIINPNIYPDCPQHNPRMNIRKSAVGQITATDGTVITVPADTAAGRGLGPKSYDLYNECKQITPANTSEVSTANVPVVEIDADGEVITGYIVADNYYEMWVNGKLVSVDNTPYTPFNSAIVKFKVKRPYTMAFLLVDWDERLGLGMEQFPVPVTPATSQWYPGDGGLIARFSDGTMTDSSWKAQTFFIGPLMDPKEVVERGNIHDTPNLGGRNWEAEATFTVTAGGSGAGMPAGIVYARGSHNVGHVGDRGGRCGRHLAAGLPRAYTDDNLDLGPQLQSSVCAVRDSGEIDSNRHSIECDGSCSLLRRHDGSWLCSVQRRHGHSRCHLHKHEQSGHR